MGAPALDPPETVLGQLQRGLGRAHLAATRGGAGEGEWLHCVSHDPRWDRQLEERAAYYAKLGLELCVDVTPVGEAVRSGDPRRWDGGLAADVLMEMAVRGRADALQALRAELRHDGWLAALTALERAREYGRNILTPSDLNALAGRPADELRVAIERAGHLPWREWATTMSSIASLLDEAGFAESPRPEAAKPDTSMTTNELLAIAEPRNGVKVARVLAQRKDAASIAAMIEAARGSDRDAALAACRALGALGHTGLLEHLDEVFGSPNPAPPRRHRGVARYLDGLSPDHTLPRARVWLSKGGYAAVAAERILAREALAEDRSLVETTLGVALDDGAVYRACSMVEALESIGDRRSTELLVQTFERIPYSWARPRVLRALAASRSDALAALAREALWDCDEEAREVAAVHAPREMRERLAQLADDGLEAEGVRDAARAGLG